MLVRNLIPWFVTRQVFTGAGKIGSENGADAVDFQISQRADFFEEEVGLETTLKRPIVNTRDEPHADPQKYRRLHVIVGDANLCEVATFLKVGATAIVLAMIEDGFIDKDLSIIAPGPRDARGLARPDAAARRSTSRRSVAARRSRCSGSSCGSRASTPTRPASKRAAATRSARWCSTAGKQVLDRARARPVGARRPARLGHEVEPAARVRRPRRAELERPEARRCSTSSTTTCGRPGRSTSASCAAGKIERLVDEADVRAAMVDPPETTRAYFRGTCLARWADSVVAANWDSLVLDVGSDPLRRIPMMEPTRGSKVHVARVVHRGVDAPPARRAARVALGGI